jgi:uncharacterized membrane protein
MMVLAVLVAGILLARLLGALGARRLASWPAAVRVGLAAMLLFTASAHFTPMRHDLARMMPPSVPSPMAVVYFTGLCEIAGALGLLVPRTRRAAAWALIAFFVAVLPANIHAARAGVTLRGAAATPLAIRIPMQVAFIALTWWSGIRRSREPASARS